MENITRLERINQNKNSDVIELRDVMTKITTDDGTFIEYRKELDNNYDANDFKISNLIKLGVKMMPFTMSNPTMRLETKMKANALAEKILNKLDNKEVNNE